MNGTHDVFQVPTDTTLACADAERARSWWHGFLHRVTALWREDGRLLRALAAIEDDRISDLSDEGRALRRAARRRFRLPP